MSESFYPYPENVESADKPRTPEEQALLDDLYPEQAALEDAHESDSPA